MNISYVPAAERTPDTQYLQALQAILREGIVTPVTAQDKPCRTLFGGKVSFVYRLENGFPMLWERNMSPKISEKLPVTTWRQSVGEILGFINGARTTQQLEAFGCYWWDKWATAAKCAKRNDLDEVPLKPGDLGPGSYGAVYATYPLPGGGTFNQVETLIRQIIEHPELRTHWIEPWYAPANWRIEGRTQQVVVCPCHGWVNFRVLNGALYMHMTQRSGDMYFGVPNNIIEHAALGMVIARATGYPLVEYCHTVSDAHIYETEIEAVENILIPRINSARTFPTLTLDPLITDAFAVRHEHFELSDYHPFAGIKGLEAAV